MSPSIRLIPEDASRDGHNARAIDELEAVKARQQALDSELSGLPPGYRRLAVAAELQELRIKALHLQRDVVVDVIARLQKSGQ